MVLPNSYYSSCYFLLACILLLTGSSLKAKFLLNKKGINAGEKVKCPNDADAYVAMKVLCFIRQKDLDDSNSTVDTLSGR